MQGIDGSQHSWDPFSSFGIHNNFLKLNPETLINTWLTLFVIVVFVGVARFFIFNKKSAVRFMLVQFIESFIDLCIQSLGVFVYHHFAFVASLFIFILVANWLPLIPFAEEPTKDLNTTLALGLISFFYKEFYHIQAHGFGGYLKEFFQPFFVMFPINVIGHFSKIISISFRLFGNIFGGSIITSIYNQAIATSWITQIIGLFSLNFIVVAFFILFEGFIQAFVFSMLTLTYLALAIQTDQGETT